VCDNSKLITTCSGINIMIKFFLIIFGILYSQITFASTICQPSEIVTTFKQNDNLLHVSISGKNNCIFSYYSPFHENAPVFIGFKLESGKGYRDDSISSPMLRFSESDDKTDADSKKFVTFFTENNKLFSEFIINGAMSSQSYGYPLENKYYQKTNNIDFVLNLDSYLKQFKPIFETNHLSGKQNIIFEIKLIQDAQLNQSFNYYFSDISYNLGY
jgi:hypothetical protein